MSTGNVEFSQKRFDEHDYVGCEAVKGAMRYLIGELQDNPDKYAIDLIRHDDNIYIEVEHCGESRWRDGTFPKKLLPPDIPLRKEQKMIDAISKGRYAYAWVRYDCRLIMMVWIDSDRFGKCKREIRDTKYKKGEPFLLPRYEWFQYISVPQMYWKDLSSG